DHVTFLREAAEETVLVHAARAAHAPVQLPAWVVGRHLDGLAGTRDLAADGGVVTLSASGPEFGVWRCGSRS
ncbi:MAG: hypothetical protein WAS07_10250, partial [Micropruina sp.]